MNLLLNAIVIWRFFMAHIKLLILKTRINGKWKVCDCRTAAQIDCYEKMRADKIVDDIAKYDLNLWAEIKEWERSKAVIQREKERRLH